jgi:hypothetical protein
MISSSLRLAAVGAALALSAASPYDPITAGLYADQSLCVFQLSDANGQAYQYDLRPVGAEVMTFKTQQYVYEFSPCGIAAPACTPPYGQYWPLSAGYQTQGGPGSGTCWDQINNSYVPCSGTCEGLAVGPPQHQLLDPNNAATGGISTSYAGMWTPNSDSEKCGNIDPVRGKELGRSLEIVHICSPNMPPGVVNVTSQSENPACHYIFNVLSSAACGVKVSQPNPPLPGPSPALPVWAPGAGPMAPYLCSPNLTDTSGKKWGFSFSQLFNPTQDYSVTGSDGTAYNFNICGYTSTTCTPSYSVAANFGGVVATWGPANPPPSGATCYWANGTQATCTNDCRTLGEGAPSWSLANPSNGATGGVTMALQGEFAYADEPTSHICGFDPYLNPVPASVTITLSCDPSTPANKLAVTGVTSGPSICTYNIQAKTAAACGA